MYEKFLEFCSATGLKENTVRKYRNDLKTLTRHLGRPLWKLTKPLCGKFFSKIEGNGYSEATKNHYKITIRKFIKWKNGEVPKFLEPYLKIKEYNIIRPLPYILDEREMLKILSCCKNLQEKTFFGIIMETGCRADELISTKLKEVHFDNIGGLIIRPGKGGRLRRIRIIKTGEWLKKHYVIRSQLGKEKLFDYNYWQVRGILRRLERISKIGKHLNLHLFRKVVATKLASKMTEYQLCQAMGWVPGSRSARHYVFMSGRDIDPVLKKLNSGSWN